MTGDNQEGGGMKVGDKVEVISNEGVEEYGINVGDVGMINAIVALPEGEMVFFMQEGSRKQFVVKSDRFKVIGQYTGSDLPEVS